MSQANDKAKRATVQNRLDFFQMRDGSYRTSIAGAAGVVGLIPKNVFEFLRSKVAKRLLDDGFTGSFSEVEVESPSDQQVSQTRIQAIPLNVVGKYWLWECYKGNKQAFAIVDALLEESLERRFDAAFGVERSEDERNDILTQRLQQTVSGLSALGDHTEFDIRTEREARIDKLEQQLRDAGLEPWQPPTEDGNDG